MKSLQAHQQNNQQNLTPVSCQIGDIKKVIQGAVKIKDVNLNEIKSTLLYCFAVTGLRGERLPDEIEKAVLLDFVKTQYQHNSLEEIKIAFTLTATKRLEVDSHFQQFSCLYFGQVMKAYNEQVRTKAVEQINRDRMNEDKVQPKSDAEQQEIRKEYLTICILKPIEAFKEGNELKFTIRLKDVYKALKDARLVNLSEDDRSTLKTAKTIEINNLIKQQANQIPLTKAESIQKNEAKAYLKGENDVYFDALLQDACRLEAIKISLKDLDITEIRNKLVN